MKFSTRDKINPRTSFKRYVKKQDEEINLKRENLSPIITERFRQIAKIPSITKFGILKKMTSNGFAYKSETKNIPKNFGVLLKNYLSEKNTDNPTIQNFLINGETKKNFSRGDFKKLFNDETAVQLAREYFSGFQIIHDLMISEKIQDLKIHLKYIRKFYNSTFNHQELDQLKIN